MIKNKPEAFKKIMASAIEEFAANGYEGTSAKKIMERAGLSKGLLFHYFKSKENLFIECAQKALKDYMDYVFSEEVFLIDDCFERVKAVAIRKVDYFIEHQAESRFVIYMYIIMNKEEFYKIKEIVMEERNKIKSEFFADVDISKFRSDFEPEFILEYIYIVIEAYSTKIEIGQDLTLEDAVEIREKFLNRFEFFEKLIKYGIY
ncbi:TetR/AcrR family transcriptional regulator [Anaeropeptidivorans aminofermentans]|uniref:TetR/AcrR family transcriptional regulator n=1 Tax=Anaeropeptidivorans aminofermentans TaxID=2934315 RepID=UPI002023BE7C|nr:TetR/AcrR family transcriptional regulator [Anaeropeptidivorans aminofermentans]